MYTYAFLLNSDRPLDLPEGIWGSLELVCLDELAALVEPDLPANSLQHDRQLMQAVLSHGQVIQELFQQTVVLPLRFGTYFVSRQGLLDHLRSHRTQYLNKLIHLQGKAEYVVKLVPVPAPAASSPSPSQSSDFTQTSLEQRDWQQKQQAEFQSLVSLFSEYYPDFVQGKLTENIQRVYLLSSPQQSSQLAEHLQNWQPQFRRWVLSLGETLPPYHFV